jgi:hypothetical protein
MKMEQSVPKRRHIKFRRREITQKKTYNRNNLFYIPSQQTEPQQEVNLCSIWVSLRGSADDSSIMERFAVLNSK